MPETVPADIAAAMYELQALSYDHGKAMADGDRSWIADALQNVSEARAALNAAILTHLRKAEERTEELKTALERITSGAA